MCMSYSRSSLGHTVYRLQKGFLVVFVSSTVLIPMLLNRSCPIASLSVEALTEIFLLARPSPFDFDSFVANNWHCNRAHEIRFDYPLHLGAVCASWRQVAWSTPSLWTFFAYSPDPKSEKLAPQFLSLYIRNSGNLQVHLYFGSHSYSTRSSLGTLVGPVIQVNAPRIETLLLYNPPRAWFYYLDKWTSLINLAIRWSFSKGPVTEELFLNRCHRLCRLSIDNLGTLGTHKVLYKLPWSLTVLRLSGIPIDTCIKLFLRCPNLKDAQIASPRLPHVAELDGAPLQSWFGSPAVFRHLTSLYWERRGIPDVWSDTFLICADMPSLATLHFVFPQGHPAALRAEERIFFRHLPQTCLSLVITQLRHLIDIPRIFKPSSPLEKVTLVRCDMAMLYGFFNKLKSVVGGSGGIYPMPKLTALIIRGAQELDVEVDESLDEFEPRHFEPLVDMLEQRLQAGDEFSLTLTGFAVDWTPGAQKRLRNLVKKGIRLEIVEGSDVVDWLRVD